MRSEVIRSQRTVFPKRGGFGVTHVLEHAFPNGCHGALLCEEEGGWAGGAASPSFRKGARIGNGFRLDPKEGATTYREAL